MPTITLPRRRFHAIRGFFRNWLPRFYGWAVNNSLMRELYGKIKGQVVVQTGETPQEIFTAIYQHHHWDDGESRSGGGSNLVATRRIRAAIPRLIEEFNIRTIFDAPCGDFHWFKEMNLPLDSYIGGDIVAPLIEENNRKYARPDRSFLVIDITKDPLPDSDLLLNRDCLIHLTNDMVVDALKNIAGSKIRYLLTTNYADCTMNADISPGQYRPINLMLPPFNLPPPIRTIDDFADGFPPRQLMLWEVNTLVRCIGTR